MRNIYYERSFCKQVIEKYSQPKQLGLNYPSVVYYLLFQFIKSTLDLPVNASFMSTKINATIGTAKSVMAVANISP